MSLLDRQPNKPTGSLDEAAALSPMPEVICQQSTVVCQRSFGSSLMLKAKHRQIGRQTCGCTSMQRACQKLVVIHRASDDCGLLVKKNSGSVPAPDSSTSISADTVTVHPTCQIDRANKLASSKNRKRPARLTRLSLAMRRGTWPISRSTRNTEAGGWTSQDYAPPTE